MTRVQILAMLSCAVVVGGCGGATVPLRMVPGHPANPQSPEALVARLAPLEPDAFDRTISDGPGGFLGDSVTTVPTGGHTMPTHHQHGSEMRGLNVPAPASGDSTSKQPPSPNAATFVCPMHPDVTDVKASRCPKCGMTLVHRKEKR